MEHVFVSSYPQPDQRLYESVDMGETWTQIGTLPYPAWYNNGGNTYAVYPGSSFRLAARLQSSGTPTSVIAVSANGTIWDDRTGNWFGVFTDWSGASQEWRANVFITGPGFYSTHPDNDATAGEECGTAATEECVAANTNQQSQPQVGGPINPRTGNYVYGVTDLTVRGRSDSLSFRRIYSAYRLRWADSVLGPGWTHNYNMRLILDTDPEGALGRIIFQEANGSRQRFIDHGDGTYTPELGLLAQLARSGTPGSYVYTMTLTNQLRYQFDNAGRLTQIDRLSGTGTWNPVILTYDANGHLSRVADGSRYLEFGYDANGRMTTVYDHRRATDPNSPAVTYTYDAAGNLASATDLRGQTWTYQYTDILHPHHLTAVLDPLNHVVEQQTYDTEGRVTEQRDGQDAIIVNLNYLDDRHVVVTDGRGNAQTSPTAGGGPSPASNSTMAARRSRPA